MESETVFCRLCMTSGSKQNLTIMTKDLCIKAFLCVCVKVNFKSKPEAMLCKICCNQLVNFYNFKKKCLENNVKYKVLNAKCKNGALKKIESNSDDIFLPHILDDYCIKEKESDTEHNSKIENEWKEAMEDDVVHIENLDAGFPDNDSGDSQRLSKKEFDIATEPHKISILQPNPATTVRSALPKVRKSLEERNKIFQCEECGRTFKVKSVIKKHIMSHMGLKLYSCDICSKKFTRDEHKRVHMRAHNGIKPYICEICGKTSSKRQDLLRHKLIHSEEKKYECMECGKKFKTSYSVRSHMTSHSENRLYSCKSCDKCYKSNSALQKHLKSRSHFKKDEKNKKEI